jgi:hypothetical protein
MALHISQSQHNDFQNNFIQKWTATRFPKKLFPLRDLNRQSSSVLESAAMQPSQTARANHLKLCSSYSVLYVSIVYKPSG